MSEPERTGPYQPDESPDGERFAPGTLLAGRYRVVAALGRGGMGEVYRADDLNLGQPVALKFLPERWSADADRLARFRKEVATARRVSHPHCCRVYDLGESPRGDGESPLAFLTMEYVDGESLSSLIERVGRLPEEKAVAVARELCQAVQAVHDQGLVHRDLKPANVMLDGRGKVRLTDFGLAAAAVELSDVDAASGTPQYMAPEQLARREVTARSDLFSLGMVLYELFTGKPAFQDKDRDTPPSKPSSHVTSLDPTVERMILRCLERDPTGRPRSAIEVLAGLPGGDPLAAAVAAGETPSPRLVADAGEVGLIKPWIGLALVAAVAVELFALAAVLDRFVFVRVPLPKPPEVLVDRCQELLRRLGHSEPAADWAGGLRVDDSAEHYAYRNDPTFARGEPAHVGGPAPVYFSYRRGPAPLAPLFNGGGDSLMVSDENPPPIMPGMAGVSLDPAGHLLSFYSLAPVPDSRPAGPTPVGWDEWFREAGLERDRFAVDPAGPTFPAPAACAKRFAWRDTTEESGCRVEAGADHGRPVYFRVGGPWHRAVRRGLAKSEEENSRETASRYTTDLWNVIFAAIVVLAVRNLLGGHADVGTAVRMGAVIGGLALVARATAGWHAADALGFFPAALGWAAWVSVVAGGSYLGVEPAVRRRWPWRLTGWVRLFAGRLRDPLVGRDLLVGIACGVLFLLAYTTAGEVAVHFAAPAGFEPSLNPTWFSSGAYFGATAPAPARILGAAGRFFGAAFFDLCLALVVFLLTRRESVAWAAVFAVTVALSMLKNWSGSWSGDGLMMITLVVQCGVTVALLIRFGLLAAATASGTQALLLMTPLSADPSAWYFGTGLIIAAGVVVVASYCCYTAVGGWSVLRAGLIGDE
jgi:serine/threonine-protein kinase